MGIKRNNNIDAFFALVRAGLWRNEVQLMPFELIDFSEVLRLAEEQSVVGLVAAGLELVVDTKVPKQDVLQFIGQTLQLEERNKAMNYFIGVLVDKMAAEGISTILVKGQGVAQCYEKPLWRASGDVDFYLSENNYKKAKDYLIPLAQSTDNEDKKRRHLAMTIGPWCVELHGTMHTEISKRINDVLDDVHQDLFINGNVRSWINDGVSVNLPDANNDVVIIFTHFINHFYAEGVGLRQICDWCRLLWTYKCEINTATLEKRLRKMALMTEWKSFACFAVEYVGMPVDAMPFYENKNKYCRKAGLISKMIIDTGSFGSKKDNSYRNGDNKLVVYTKTFFRRLTEFGRVSFIFPNNAPKFFFTYVFHRMSKTIF